MSTETQLESRRMKLSLSAVVQEYLNSLRRLNRSPRTIDLYRRVLGYFEQHLQIARGESVAPISAVTLEGARSYIAAQMEREQLYLNHPLHKAQPQRLSMFTIHQHVRILHAFGGWLARNDYPNTLSKLEFPKLPKRLIEVLSEEDIDRLFNLYGPHTHFGARWRAMLAFFLQSGVRLSELIGLTLDRLELERYRARIIGKGDKERYVPFGTKAHAALSRYIHLHRPETTLPQVFLNLDGTAPTVSSVQHIIQNVRAKSGIAKFHAHLCRHTFATQYLLAGGNVFELQEILGHEDLETTRCYVHLAQILSRNGAKPDHMQRRVTLVDEMPGLNSSSAVGRGGRSRTPEGRFATRPTRARASG